MKKIIRFAVIFGVSVLVITGCDTIHNKQLERQLQRVARDWSMTIRASQIMPVYPLTSDLQPGDVFMADRSITEESQKYDEKGYLPLLTMITRLQPTPSSYSNFYQVAYAPEPKGNQAIWITSNSNPPAWTKPSYPLPIAAFPAYTIDVDSSAGINAAFPIQAIPVGLNLLGANKAKVSVQIKGALTYGIDLQFLYQHLNSWLETHSIDDFVQNGGSTNYLRLIYRVFLATNVAVTIQSTSANTFGASGGIAKEVPLITLTTNNSQNYSNIVTLSNILNASATPGGTLKFASANNRSVTLNQSFDTPIVIGYLCADIQLIPVPPPNPPEQPVAASVEPNKSTQSATETNALAATNIIVTPVAQTKTLTATTNRTTKFKLGVITSTQDRLKRGK